jgi:hypothetical protein
MILMAKAPIQKAVGIGGSGRWALMSLSSRRNAR